MQKEAVQLKVTVVQAVNKIFRGMNMDLTNETVVKTNFELVGVMASSSPTSQQLVQPKLIHGILTLDPAKVSNNIVMKNNLELVGVMASSSATSQ